MEDLNDLLASMSDEEEETEAPKPKQSPEDNRIAAYAKKLERQRKEQDKELEMLRAWKADQELRERTSTLTDAGLTPGQAKAFMAMNPEVTQEAITEFRREVLGLQPATEQEEAPPPISGGLPPTQGVPETGQKTFSRTEIEQIARTDWNRAEELYKAGRVELDRK